jgi:molybdopterin synthase catalytic subunit
MKVLAIAGGTESGRSDLARRLADRLGAGGRVGLVDAAVRKGIPDRPPEADLTYRLGDDGDWTATGTDLSLAEALDRLAVECDYAVVAGFPDADVAQVVLGGADHGGTALVEAPTADDVDLDEVVDAFRTVEPYETLESLVERAKRSPDAERAGAIATFTGRVRAKESEEDAPTTHLEFEKYEGVAEERMDAIQEELEEREGVHEVLAHHRTGVIEYGEDIVFVVVLAGHRTEAFETVEDGINRLKDEVPIFKKERTVDEQFWVHDRD